MYELLPLNILVISLCTMLQFCDLQRNDFFKIKLLICCSLIKDFEDLQGTSIFFG